MGAAEVPSVLVLSLMLLSLLFRQAAINCLFSQWR